MRYSISLAPVFLLAVVLITTLHADEPGSIVVWGSPSHGQDDIPTPNRDFKAIAANEFVCMGLKTDGSIVVWHCLPIYSDFCDVPPPNTGFVAISAGQNYHLGLKADGSIVTWGYNVYGECDVPPPNTGFVAVSAGLNHNLGLKADGSVVAWGKNWWSQCDVPDPNTDFIAISAGGSHSLGLKADGSVVAWGDNIRGQCDVPAPNTNFVAVSAGNSHSLGLKKDGSVVAWGYNFWNQCDVPGWMNIDYVDISAGHFHSLGLKADGSVVAWGTYNYGLCNIPTPNTGFTAIAAGQFYSMGIRGGVTQTGSLQVTIEPQEAIDAGAQWRRVGTQTWYDSGYIETDIPAGVYIIEFKDIIEWTKPENLSVNILSDQTTQTFGAYTIILTGTINSASWSKSLCYNGNSVLMTVQAEGLDGSDVTFEIYEMDSHEELGNLDEFLGEVDEYVTTIKAGVVQNNKAEAYWRAKWQQDGLWGLLNPPEFYFKVRIGDLSLDSGLLEVLQQTEAVIRPMIGLPVIQKKGKSFEITIKNEIGSYSLTDVWIMISPDFSSVGNEIITLEIVGHYPSEDYLYLTVDLPDYIRDGLYDLKVTIEGRELIRPNAVCVISEFKTNPHIYHITDVHMDFSPMDLFVDPDYTNMDYKTADAEMSCDYIHPDDYEDNVEKYGDHNHEDDNDYEHNVVNYGKYWMERTRCFSRHLSIAEKNGVDFILIGGDSVDWSTDKNWRLFYEELQKSNVPTYVQVGNHDYRDEDLWEDISLALFPIIDFDDESLEFYWDNICSKEHFMNYSFDYGESLRVIGLNSGPDDCNIFLIDNVLNDICGDVSEDLEGKIPYDIVNKISDSIREKAIVYFIIIALSSGPGYVNPIALDLVLNDLIDEVLEDIEGEISPDLIIYITDSLKERFTKQFTEEFHFIQGKGFTEQQMYWLEDNLKMNRNNILFFHHPVYWGKEPDYDYTTIKNCHSFRRTYDKNNNVIAVFSGHTHYDSKPGDNGSTENGTKYFITNTVRDIRLFDLTSQNPAD